MIDLGRLEKVARFELRDALRSKLVIIVVGLFAAGAGLGALGFIKALQAAEKSARRFLAQQNGVPEELIPMDEVKAEAIAGLIRSVADEGMRETLLNMQPLAIFYGFAALYLVPLLVLTLSGGTHAADIDSGAARFALFRCDRPTWALGKMVGHALLLLLGLVVGALVAGTLGAVYQPEFESKTFLALLVASGRAWIYGVAYLGIFSGISLVSGAPLRARALSLFALIGCGVGHLVLSSDWLEKKAPPLSYLRFLLPGEYERGLWLSDPLPVMGHVLVLGCISAAGLALGTSAFMRRDA